MLLAGHHPSGDVSASTQMRYLKNPNGTLAQLQLQLVRAGKLTTAVSDTALAQVVRGHLYGNLVASEYSNVMFTHLAGNVGSHDMPVFQLHTEHGVREGVYDCALHFYWFFFSH